MTAPTAWTSVLVAEDDPTLRRFIGLALRPLQIDLEVVEDGRAALARLRERSFDLLLTDGSMPEMGGLELLAAAREVAPGMPVVLMSAEEGYRREALLRGARAFLAKPFGVMDVVRLLPGLPQAASA